MGRLIYADKLREDVLNLPNCYNGFSDTYDKAMIVDLVDEQLDLQPTAEKHGHWVEENTRTHSMQFKCSVCGRIAYYPQNHHSTEPKRCGYAYCPNCGARMDGGKDDD